MDKKSSTDVAEVIKLIVNDPKGRAFDVSLPPGDYYLGRNEDCDIRFPETAKTISRRHALIKVSEDSAKLVDLESRGGTMINGQVIREQVLERDDVITVSDFMISVRFLKEPEVVSSRLTMAAKGVGSEDAVELLASDLEAVKNASDALFAEIGKRIIGQKEVVRNVWATIIARGHCLMIGVPGLAKTYLVTTFSDALGLNFKRIQFTPDLMPSDIIGSNVIQETEEGRRTFEFVQGPIFTQLLLADEINRTPPKTQAALLEAMQEHQVTVANRSLSLPSPFCVIASQNPIEQEGTYPLPEAQQDRFMLCQVLDYPDRGEEVDILLNTTQGSIPRVNAVMEYMDILRFQSIVDRIAVSREMAEYAADLARATRPATGPAWIKEAIDWGAGPRAGQALIRTAKAIAAIEGRPAISSLDIKEIAVPVMRHRISCNYRARTSNLDEETIIKRLLDEVKVP